MAKISVMGTGSWGTALAILLHNNGHQVMLWSAHPEKAASLNQTREDPKKLPGIKIPDGIVITGDEKTALDSPDIVVFASPSAYMRAISKRLSPLIRQGQIIVNVAKGVEENTLMPVCDIIKEEIPQADVCVLSGPSHAEEVSRGLPTTCVVSARKKETAEYLQGLFMSPVFRVYTTPDMLGVELGGALKNVIALAAGTADGLGYGDNTKAALITRGIAEMARLGVNMRAISKRLSPLIRQGQIIVNVAKGVEENTLMPVCDIIKEEIPQADVCVLSGPSHAEEVSRGLPTTCVVSARKKETAEYLQGLFMSPVFRVYTTPDMLGVELGGALKNVIALAAGTADGLGYGDNTKAALITRGIAEMARLGVKMGAKLETFAGLSGIGDLIVTCASVHSRNRRAGYLMGQGYTMKQAMDEVQMVVEGVYSAKAAKALAEKYNVEMPIIMEVNKLLFENKPASEAVKDLMQREKQGEISWEL